MVTGATTQYNKIGTALAARAGKSGNRRKEQSCHMEVAAAEVEEAMAEEAMEALAEATETMATVEVTEASITLIITANLAALAPLDTEVSGGSASGILAIIGVVSTLIPAAACLH
jgi:hypothetical protein